MACVHALKNRTATSVFICEGLLFSLDLLCGEEGRRELGANKA